MAHQRGRQALPLGDHRRVARPVPVDQVNEIVFRQLQAVHQQGRRHKGRVVEKRVHQHHRWRLDVQQGGCQGGTAILIGSRPEILQQHAEALAHCLRTPVGVREIQRRDAVEQRPAPLGGPVPQKGRQRSKLDQDRGHGDGHSPGERQGDRAVVSGRLIRCEPRHSCPSPGAWGRLDCEPSLKRRFAKAG